jgi:tRNA(fMet)-specific endonuclease VapC
MPNSPTYLLDTGILLHWVRGSKVAEVIEGQFQLRASNFRPLICEVSLGEIEAFARSEKWGEQKRNKLKELRKELVAVDISDSRVIDAYADFSSLAKANGWAIFHDKNDLWIAAATKVSTATLLTTDVKAFQPLRDGKHLDVVLLDPMTGWELSSGLPEQLLEELENEDEGNSQNE